MSTLRDYQMLDVGSAPVVQDFLGDSNRAMYGANYRNASSAPVFVRLKLEGGTLAQGEIALGREASIQISEKHVGFEMRAPSAPSLLEVRVLGE